MLRAIAPRMPVSGITSPGCGPATGAGVEDGFAAAGALDEPAAFSTSDFVMRPPTPVPVICERSTPSSAARRRTIGPTNCPATSPDTVLAGAGTAAGAAATNSSTSSETIRPPGPDPRTAERSTFAAAATRRAFGDDLMRDPSSGPPTTWATGAAVSTTVSSAAAGAAPSGVDSPSASSQPMSAPTGRTSPVWATVARMPSPSASTSTSTLSVASRRMGSPT